MKLVATNKTKLKLKHNLPKKYWTSPKFNVFLWEDSYPNSQPPGTPRPTVSLWLFQFHDSKSLHGKWLFNHFQPLKIGWLSSSRQLLIQAFKRPTQWNSNFQAFKKNISHPLSMCSAFHPFRLASLFNPCCTLIFHRGFQETAGFFCIWIKLIQCGCIPKKHVNHWIHLIWCTMYINWIIN